MKKTTSFRLLGLFLAMFAMSLPSQASDLIDAIRDAYNQANHYYSRVTVKAVGEGLVYANYKTSATPEYAEQIVAHTVEAGEENGNPQTYYLYAQANEGWEFAGWYEDDESCSGDPDITVANTTVQVTSHKGSDIQTGSDADHHYYAKFVRETVSVTVSSAGYATFCSEKAVDFTDSGIEAFTAILNGTSLTLNAITQVPANTGVILVAESGKTAEVPTIVGSVEPVEDNCLTGVNEQTTLDPDDLILNVKNGKPGFYRAASNTTLKAHRAYIAKSYFAGEVKDFTFGEDDATGIETIENAVEDGAIYNMAGQRLNKMQKGINIVNGKKILKK